jgi:hypothetical protein
MRIPKTTNAASTMKTTSGKKITIRIAIAIAASPTITRADKLSAAGTSKALGRSSHSTSSVRRRGQRIRL